MAAIPIKPQYGPTLGRILVPRWRAAGPAARALAIAAALAVVALAAAIVFTFQDTKLSYHGPVSFSFRYRNLFRTAPHPGEYVRLERPKHGSGRLTDYFTVLPLHLPPYSGNLNGELPLVAAARIRQLHAQLPAFDLQGEGKAQANQIPGYAITFSTTIGGRRFFGRDMLLPRQTRGARDGVELLMLSRPTKRINLPNLVGSVGLMQLPLRSFSFG